MRCVCGASKGRGKSQAWTGWVGSSTVCVDVLLQEPNQRRHDEVSQQEPLRNHSGRHVPVALRHFADPQGD